MTEAEFRDEVYDIDTLYRFCEDNGYETIVEDIVYTDDINDYIISEVKYMIDECCYTWDEVRDWLTDIPRCTWYDTSDGISDADYSFDCLFSDLYDALMGDGFFSNDDSCDETEEATGVYRYVSNEIVQEDDSSCPFEPGTPVQISELINASCAELGKIVIM